MGVTTSTNSAVTYTPIATQTLGSSAASVTFSSIPATYTDLILQGTFAYTATTGMSLKLNNDSTTTYTQTVLYGTGSTASSGRETTNPFYALFDNWVATGSTGFTTFTLHLPNYANTTTYKTLLERSGNAAYEIVASVGLWRATPQAINRIDLTCNQFAAGSTFSLYGIQSA